MTTTELKKKMALPPIPIAPTKDRKDRDRTRIRMEIGMDQCSNLMDIIHLQLVGLTVKDEAFKPLYNLFHSLQTQYKKAEAANG